jgi:hypothetical protein
VSFGILHISDLHRSGTDPIGNDELLSTLLADRDRGSMLGRRSVPAVILITVAVVAAGCLPNPRSWIGSGIHVAFVGDSITYNTEHDALHDANHHLTDVLVAAGYAVSSSDKIGAKTADLARLGPWPAPGATIVSIEIGTNDMRLRTVSPLRPMRRPRPTTTPIWRRRTRPVCGAS